MKPLALFLFIGAIASAQTPVINSTPGTPATSGGTTVIKITGTPIASGGTRVIGGGGTPALTNGGYIQWTTGVGAQTMTAGALYYIGTPANLAFTVPGLANSAVTAGRLTALYTYQVGTIAAGNTITVTVYDGATPTALKCTLIAGSVKCSDFAHAASVNQGDLIYVTYQCAGTCGAASIGTTIASVGIQPATAQQLPGPLMRRKNATIAGKEKHR